MTVEYVFVILKSSDLIIRIPGKTTQTTHYWQTRAGQCRGFRVDGNSTSWQAKKARPGYLKWHNSFLVEERTLDYSANSGFSPLRTVRSGAVRKQVQSLETVLQGFW